MLSCKQNNTKEAHKWEKTDYLLASKNILDFQGTPKSENENESPDFSRLIYGVTILSEDNLKWLEKSPYHRKLKDKEMEQNKSLNLFVNWVKNSQF